MDEIVEVIDVIVGMDVTGQLARINIYENGPVEFRGVHCAVSMQPIAMTCENSGTSLWKVKNKDFSASFDGEK